MDAVILCEFPSNNANARSWVLDHVAPLATTNKAELSFVGIEQTASGRDATETIAIRIVGSERANEILSDWRRDVPFPGFVETRLLRIENVNFVVAMFP